MKKIKEIVIEFKGSEILERNVSKFGTGAKRTCWEKGKGNCGGGLRNPRLKFVNYFFRFRRGWCWGVYFFNFSELFL